MIENVKRYLFVGYLNGWFPVCSFTFVTQFKSYGRYGGGGSGSYNVNKPGCALAFIAGTKTTELRSITFGWSCA